MKRFNLVRHDFRNGVLRWRYLTAAGLFMLPSLQMRNILSFREESGTWMDFVFYVFSGIEPITNPNTLEQVQLPISWLIIFGACLFLNLDYLFHDLTRAGQQLLVRSNSRNSWYLSKCFWNITSCGVYFLIGLGATFVMAVISGSEVSLLDTPTITYDLLMLNETAALTASQALCIGVLLPLLTMITLSILQMTLSLFLKPILSFLICIGLLVVAVYVNTPYVIGNGAMVIRSAYLTDSGMDPGIACIVCAAVLAVCIVLGVIRFRYTDILEIEE